MVKNLICYLMELFQFKWLNKNSFFSDRNIYSSQINQNDNNHEIVNNIVGLSFFHPLYDGIMYEYLFYNNHWEPNDRLPINSQQTNLNLFFQQNSREPNFQNRQHTIRIMATIS